MDTGQRLFDEHMIPDIPSVSLSQESIAFCMEPDTLSEGGFIIKCDKGKKVKGRVYTTHWRMQCKTGSRFQGSICEIAYLFDSTGMELGDTIKGQFLIVCDRGEYRLPFAVTAQPRYITTSEGKCSSLSAFLNLTQIDMDAAYQAYVHPQFVNALRGEDARLLQWYYGLNQDGFSYQSMLEFLRVSGHPVQQPETESLKTELKRFYAQNGQDLEKHERRKQIVRLFRLYLQFRSGKRTTQSWIEQSKELLVDLRSKGPYKEFYVLGMVHMYLMEKNTAFAKDKLDEFANTHYDLQKNVELYGYYLYLSALQRNSAAFLEQVCGQIRALYERYPNSGILLWVLLMIDQELLAKPEKRIHMLEEVHNAGVRSPVLYIEAVMLYRKNPQMIGRLSPYEVHVLVFARRQGLLNQAMMDRIVKLALGCRDFSTTMYTLLKECYKANPQRQCVHAICTLLIKGHKTGEEYFEWYRRGVEEDLRITSLHDYYMYSMTETMDTPIHESVLAYFQYNQDLDYRKKAYLFANLMKFQDRYPQLYESYYNDMVDFVVRQLDKGRVSTHLMYLYQKLVNRQYVGAKNAYHIADFIFSYRLTDIPEKAAAVIVSEPALAEEITVSVKNGEAIVPVYSEEACLFYRLSDGSRSCLTDKTAFERWFDKEALLPLCERYCPSHPGILLRKCERLVRGEEKNWQVLLAQLTANGQLSMNYRMQVWQQVLDFYYETYHHDAIEWCLAHIRIKELPVEYRNHNIGLLLSNGNYEEAFAYISTYGCEHISDKMLVRMCSRIICQKEFLYDENCLSVCREVFFRGKYDEMMLIYLIDYMDGGTHELVQLWRAGVSFGLDTYPVAKKLVARVLQTGCLPEGICDIFADYYKNCGKDNLVAAFLTFFAERILKNDLQADLRIYEWLGKELARGESLNDACRICWLYGISRYPKLLDGEEALASAILQELLLEERSFAFYGCLPNGVDGAQMFTQSTFFEYKTDSVHHVTLYYRMPGETDFTAEELEQSFPGIFVKELLLFENEAVQYYVVEQSAQEQWIAAGGTLCSAHGETAANGRFAVMENLLCMSDAEQAEAGLEAYITQSYVTEQLFAELDG